MNRYANLIFLLSEYTSFVLNMHINCCKMLKYFKLNYRHFCNKIICNTHVIINTKYKQLTYITCLELYAFCLSPSIFNFVLVNKIFLQLAIILKTNFHKPFPFDSHIVVFNIKIFILVKFHKRWQSRFNFNIYYIYI